MKINIIELKSIINECTSLSNICVKMNLINNGNTFKYLKKTIKEYDLSTEHFIRHSNRKYDANELKRLVKKSTTYSEVCRSLNIKESGGNIKTLKRKIIESNIDISHFNGKGWNKGKRYINNSKKELSSILVENSTYTNTHKLKLRLIDEGLLEYRCYNKLCNIVDEWNGSKISLQLDHINGNRKDNRLKNLRLLCPNCHSQTDTYAGKNNK
jgi:5-methylcytosine-specific restriction endonuclease McrA